MLTHRKAAMRRWPTIALLPMWNRTRMRLEKYAARFA
jgi:hypothetical protein